MRGLTPIANSSKKNSVVFSQGIQSTIWNILAGLLVDITSPIEISEMELEFTQDGCELIQDLNAGSDDLWSDAVCRYRGNLVDPSDAVDRAW